jgi:hypothetical protein
MVGSGVSEGIAWSAANQDNGFVSPDSYSTSDIACHKVRNLISPFVWSKIDIL